MLKKKTARSGSVNSDSGRNPVNLALPDNMGVGMMLRQIGVEHSWPESQINSDILVLTNNRIFTIKDLRTLSNQSWKDIELLPIVKDLCREAINRESNQKIVNNSIDNQRPKKKLSKKVSLDNLISKFHHHHPTNEMKLSRTFNKSSANPIIPYEIPQNFNKSSANPPYEISQNFNKSTSSSIPYEASQTFNNSTLDSVPYEASNKSTLGSIPYEASHTSDQSTLDDPIPYEAPQSSAEVNTQKTIPDRSPLKPIPPTSQVQNDQYYMPPPNKKIIGDGNRMKVKTSSGKIYEVDRWCPYAKTDLSARSVLIGSKLFCAKHKWAFDLENGGKCISNCDDISINACAVNDW